MNEGALDRPTFEAIEAYVLERMRPEERTAFEQRMATDAALRAEVELERESIQAVELGGLSRVLNNIKQEKLAEEREAINWKGMLKYAAILAAIVTGAIWWMVRSPLNQRIYAEHFMPDPGLPVAMGALGNARFADAMVAYKLGEYAEARAKWAPLLANEPANDTLRYYIASAWLAENNPAEAVPLLAVLAEEPHSSFNAKAKWYLFLTYVRTGQLEKARAVPLEDGTIFGQRARAIKARLED